MVMTLTPIPPSQPNKQKAKTLRDPNSESNRFNNPSESQEEIHFWILLRFEKQLCLERRQHRFRGIKNHPYCDSNGSLLRRRRRRRRRLASWR